MFTTATIFSPKIDPNIGYLGLLSIGLALSISIAKVLGGHGLHPLYIAFIQVAGSSAVLLLFTRLSFAKAIRYWRYFLAASLLGFTLPNLVVLWAANRFGVSVAAIAYALPVVVTYFVSLLLRLETFSAHKVLYIGSAVLGTVFVFEGVLTLSASLSLIVVLLAPLCVGVANIIRSELWPQSLSPLEVATMTSLFSSLSYALLIALVQPSLTFSDDPLFFSDPLLFSGSLFFSHPLFVRDPLVQGVFLLLALVALSTLGQVLLFQLQKKTRPTFVSQIGGLTALVGCFLGTLLFDEPIGPLQITGCILIIFSVYRFSNVLSQS